MAADDGCGLNPVCHAGGLVTDVVGGAAGSAIDALADAVTEAVGKALASVGTLWVKVGTPNLTTSNGGSTPSDAVAFLQGSLWWYMAAAAVLSVIIAGAKMAWEGRAEPGRELLKSLMTLVVVAGAGLTAVSLAVIAADGFAKWVIDSSLEGSDFGTNITALLGLSAITGLGAIIVIVLGLAAFVAALVQIALMVVRGGMLVILTGILPLSASSTNTEWGRAWFKKCIAWLVAFILYKPAAAIVYATAFRLAGSDVFGGDELMSAISGLVLMVLAIVALPALMRFVTPLVGAMASGGGGAGGAMAAGAIASMPTGAMRVPRGSSSNGAGAVAGGAQSGPSGASGSGGSRGPSGVNGSSPGRWRCQAGQWCSGWRQRRGGRRRCAPARARHPPRRVQARAGERRPVVPPVARLRARPQAPLVSAPVPLRRPEHRRPRAPRTPRRAQPTHRQERAQVEAAEQKVRTYGNWRKPQSAGLGQLGLIGTALLFGGLIVVILTVGFFGVFIAMAVGVVVALMLLTLIVHDRHGKTVLQRAAVRIGWHRTRASGAHLYRSGPLGLNAVGHLPAAGAHGPVDAERSARLLRPAVRAATHADDEPLHGRVRQPSPTARRWSISRRSTCGSRIGVTGSRRLPMSRGSSRRRSRSRRRPTAAHVCAVRSCRALTPARPRWQPRCCTRSSTLTRQARRRSRRSSR